MKQLFTFFAAICAVSALITAAEFKKDSDFNSCTEYMGDPTDYNCEYCWREVYGEPIQQ